MSEPTAFRDTLERLKVCFTDDAKKSVSFRMHTSDYGRLRFFASELRTRDSVAFRFLLRVALELCMPLYDRNASARDKFRLLAELGPEFATYFDFDARRLEDTFQPRTLADRIAIDEDDLELIAAFGSSRSLVRKRLEKLLNVEQLDDDLHAVLREYLLDKYLKQGSMTRPHLVAESAEGG